jgi:hypothetical protein
MSEWPTAENQFQLSARPPTARRFYFTEPAVPLRLYIPTTTPTAATPGGKKYPWKNVPPWSPLHRKLRQRSTAPRQSPTVDALYAGPDSLAGSSTELESPSKDSTALIAERPNLSPEIPETPPAALKDVRREKDNHGEDGDTPSCLR